MNNAAFGKTMENVRKQRDSNNHLISEPNYHTTILFEDLLT